METPPSRPPPRSRYSDVGYDEEDAALAETPACTLPSLGVLVTFAACSAISFGWAWYAFVLVPAADPRAEAVRGWLAGGTGLLLASPLLPWFCALSCMRWLMRHLIVPVIAQLASIASLLALLVLIVEPLVPQPGMAPEVSALCVDIGAWPPRVRLDRTAVVAGPCWEFTAEYVGGGARDRRSASAGPVLAPAVQPAPGGGGEEVEARA